MQIQASVNLLNCRVMDFKAVLQQLNKDKKEYAKGVGTPLLVLAALGMVILPLPPFLLDILFIVVDSMTGNLQCYVVKLQ